MVNGERKLRMSEVESFTDTLTQIGRSAANMKSKSCVSVSEKIMKDATSVSDNFPNLEGRLRNVMSTEMEKVVREEK